MTLEQHGIIDKMFYSREINIFGMYTFPDYLTFKVYADTRFPERELMVGFNSKNFPKAVWYPYQLSGITDKIVAIREQFEIVNKSHFKLYTPIKTVDPETIPKSEMPTSSIKEDFDDLLSFERKPDYFDAADTNKLVSAYQKMTIKEKTTMEPALMSKTLRAFEIAYRLKVGFLEDTIKQLEQAESKLKSTKD